MWYVFEYIRIFPLWGGLVSRKPLMWSLVMGGRPRSWCSYAFEIVCVGDLYRGGICRLCKMKLSISFYKRLCCRWWSAGNNNSSASSWLQLNLVWSIIRSHHSCNMQDSWKLLKSWSVLLCSSWLLAKCRWWWRSSSSSYVAACNSFNMQYLSIFIFSTFLNPSSCWSSWPINAYLVIVQSWISWLRPVAAAACGMLKSVDINDSAARQLFRSELLVSCWSLAAYPVDAAVTASSDKIEELIAWWCNTFCLTASVITGVESAGRWTIEGGVLQLLRCFWSNVVILIFWRNLHGWSWFWFVLACWCCFNIMTWTTTHGLRFVMQQEQQ